MLRGVGLRGFFTVLAEADVAMPRKRLARNSSKRLGFSRALKPRVPSVKVNHATPAARHATRVAISRIATRAIFFNLARNRLNFRRAVCVIHCMALTMSSFGTREF